MIVTLYSCVIYAYICSMVKDRMRTLNHPKFFDAHIRPPSARGYGANVTLAYAIVSLANQ